MVGTGVYEASRCFRLAGDLLLVAGFLIADLGATGFLVGELDLAIRFVGDLDLAVFFATVIASECRTRADDRTCGQTDDVVASNSTECCPYDGLYSSMYLLHRSAFWSRIIKVSAVTWTATFAVQTNMFHQKCMVQTRSLYPCIQNDIPCNGCLIGGRRVTAPS